MNRIDIINGLIAKNNYKSYLEIGVRDGSCLHAIQCHFKVGVDPDAASAANIKQISDDFFEYYSLYTVPEKFDIIFIDGLHHADQVIKDIYNSLKYLNEGGTIVMHDCLPTNEFMQEIPMRPEHNEWTGDVWKAYVTFREIHADLEMCVVDTDWGCGIIRRGHQETIKLTGPPSYQNFVHNKQEWMNIISPEEFRQRYL